MKRIVLLVVGLLTALAVTAAPASSAPKGAAASNLCNGWEAAGTASFSSIGSLTSVASTARGADAITKEPALNETYEALPDSARSKGSKSFRATVPVWFHVISAGGTGNVSQAAIDEQMTVLNLSYGGFYGGAKTGFQFKLVGVDRTDNAAWFNARAGGIDERDMKQALRQGGPETLNLYSSVAGGYLGYAYLPGLPDPRQYLDGIVFHWESMVGTSTRFAGRYDRGFTLVHEAGHWLDLEHTFYGACNAKGDFVDDTPAEGTPTSGCPLGKDTCLREPGLDPIHNYMDYSYDSCYTEFTLGQASRQQDAWLYFRAP